jgi:hypothetical protein
MQRGSYASASTAVVFLLCSALCFSQTETADRLTSPIVATQRTVTNSVHPLATRQNDLGRVTATQVLHRMVLMLKRSPAQENDLQQLLQEQQDPTSPNYHQWLTPGEFGQRFGPSANDIAKIDDWLQSQGFTVEKPSNGRQFLLFTGTSAQVESAFQTEMHLYRVNGKTHIANAKPATIPSALAPAVSGIASLNSFTRWTPQYQATYHLAPNPLVKTNSGPLTGPADLAAIYDSAPLQKANVLGQGESIALIEESNIVIKDVTDFRTISGLPAATVNVIVNGTDPGLVYGEETEAIADVEYAGAFAPDAALNVVVTASTEFNQGIDLSTAYAVDNDVAPITSLSYGGCETLNDTYSANSVALYKAAYEQGAAEGISHFVSAGDWGGDTCGNLDAASGSGYGVNAIGDSPWNVSVGGTEFIMPDANVYFPPPNYTATGYVPESAWNDYENPEDGRLLAGGGGVSINYTKPAWQTGPGVPADSARDVPDVSLVSGDNLAYMVCEADQGGNCSQGDSIGLIGTSLASPSWASIQALVNQKNNELGGAGNPNPVYYRLAAGSNSPFHDITVGDTKLPDNCFNTVFCNPSPSDLVGYEAAPGYDLATGLGSVDVNKLVTNWLPPTGTGAVTVSLSTGGTASITHGDALTATISVTASGSTVPTGDVVLLAGTQGIARITLNSTGNATLTFGATSGIELPGGAYNLSARYAGDANFAAANSSAIALTVNPEPTTTQASSNAAGSVSYGTSVTITAAAYGANSGTGYPVPGVYTFTDSAAALGTATLSAIDGGLAFATKGATASLTLTQTTSLLGAGTHQIVVASPAAGASFLSSVSTPVTVVVTKSPVLVSLTPSHTNPAINTPVNLAVTVMILSNLGNRLYASGVPVTGNVDFYDTGTSPQTKLGSVTLGAGGAGSLPVTFTSTGLHSVIAQYDGDANDLANVSGAADITVVGKVPTITTFSGGINFTYAPTPIALTVTVIGDSAGAAPTGTVTFTDTTANNGAGATIGTATLSSGSATLNASSLAAGTHNVTASYSGDANYSGSASMADEVSIIAMNLAPSPGSASVTAGQSTSSSSISFSTNPIFTNYYFSSVNLSCSGLPSGATCSFKSTSIDPTYNSSTGILSGSTSFSIYTTGPTLQKASSTPQQKPWGGLGTLALAGLLAIRFRRHRLLASLSGLVLLVFFLSLGGCGGGGGQYNISSQGTPAGTYPITITGTMNVQPFGTYMTTSTFNLTVNAPGQ